MGKSIEGLERELADAKEKLELAWEQRNGEVERAERAELALERARTYSGLEAYPCPLCKYVDGKLIELCEPHRQLRVALDRIKTEASCPCCLGSGKSPVNGHPCNDCRGSGLVAVSYDVARGRLKDLKEKLELAERAAKCNADDAGQLMERAQAAEKQRDKFAAALEKAGEALELLYSRWEDGCPCFEDGDCGGTSMGRAVQLSSEEERQCLAAMEAAGIETILRKKKGNALNPSAILARIRREAKAAGLEMWANWLQSGVVSAEQSIPGAMRSYAAALRRGEKGLTE